MSNLVRCDSCGIVSEHREEFKTFLIEEENGPFEWAPLRAKLQMYDICLTCHDNFLKITSSKKETQL